MENVFSKRADSLRPRKRKKARSPALIAKNRSLEDHLEHGDKNNNKGARAPASEMQGQVPVPQPSEEAAAGTHARPTAVYDETKPMVLGTPPGRVPDGVQASGLVPKRRDITVLKQAFDMRIHQFQTTANNEQSSRPYSLDPGSDFEVQQEPLVAARSAASRSACYILWASQLAAPFLFATTMKAQAGEGRKRQKRPTNTEERAKA